MGEDDKLDAFVYAVNALRNGSDYSIEDFEGCVTFYYEDRRRNHDEEKGGDGMEWVRLTMKWGKSCSECGASLPVGAVAFGRREDATGGWIFKCHDCNVSGRDSDTNRSIEPEVKPPPPKPKKSPLEEIKLKARWRLTE